MCVEGLGGWFILFLSSLAASILQVSFMPSKQSYFHPSLPPQRKRGEDQGSGGGGGEEEAGDGNLLSWHCKDSPPSQPVIYIFISVFIYLFYVYVRACVCVCVCGSFMAAAAAMVEPARKVDGSS